LSVSCSLSTSFRKYSSAKGAIFRLRPIGKSLLYSIFSYSHEQSTYLKLYSTNESSYQVSVCPMVILVMDDQLVNVLPLHRAGDRLGSLRNHVQKVFCLPSVNDLLYQHALTHVQYFQLDQQFLGNEIKFC